jgi:RHS repeat-associated protein
MIIYMFMWISHLLSDEDYNGKEFVEMNGYDTYDYGARGYYPEMGRFMSVDPHAEKCYSISPYAYCFYNPVRFTDPDGREVYEFGFSFSNFSSSLSVA